MMQSNHVRGTMLCLGLLAMSVSGCGDDSEPNTAPNGSPSETDGVFGAACVFEDGTCAILNEEDCEDAGGTYLDEWDCCVCPCDDDHDDDCDCDCEGEREACGLGFWKNHYDAWPSDLEPSDQLFSWFDFPDELDDFADDSLADALRYHGGNGVEGGTRLLLRDAAVALLNSAHSEIGFDYDMDDVISIVDDGLASMDRRSMQHARHHLGVGDDDNCPFDDDDDDDDD